MRNELYLGIDTSNYTTSVGLVDGEGQILANIKRPLPVAEGARGLRQSDALFVHTKNLPSAMEELKQVLRGAQPVAVGVSARPRNVEGSYMPCFLAGVSAAHAVSAALGIPLYSFSHQCGHLMAALLSSEREELLHRPFGAFHVSGGTTELLSVEASSDGFRAIHVGGTKDLNAGQVIDRIGVAMGLVFPAGPHMEALARENTKKIPQKKLATDGAFLNLSGLENMALSLYGESGDKALTAAFVLDYIARALRYLGEYYLEVYGPMPLLFSGGVMSNTMIRAMLEDRFDAAFAEPRLSADNAVGFAALARRAHCELLASRNGGRDGS